MSFDSSSTTRIIKQITRIIYSCVGAASLRRVLTRRKNNNVVRVIGCVEIYCFICLHMNRLPDNVTWNVLHWVVNAWKRTPIVFNYRLHSTLLPPMRVYWRGRIVRSFAIVKIIGQQLYKSNRNFILLDSLLDCLAAVASVECARRYNRLRVCEPIKITYNINLSQF